MNCCSASVLFTHPAGSTIAAPEYPNCIIAEPEPIDEVHSSLPPLSVTHEATDFASYLVGQCFEKTVARSQARSKAGAYDLRCDSAWKIALQSGAYISGTQIQPSQNLSDYTVFPYADLQNQNDMTPSLGSCFANSTGLGISTALTGQVHECMAKNTLCCYAAADGQVTVSWWCCMLHAASWSVRGHRHTIG